MRVMIVGVFLVGGGVLLIFWTFQEMGEQLQSWGESPLRHVTGKGAAIGMFPVLYACFGDDYIMDFPSH